MTPPPVGRGEGGTFVATNHTTNYQLNQWEAADQVLRTDFNQDNQKIDAALKTNADAIAAETAARAALAETVEGKGNCKLEHFTYRGDGGHGDESPTVIDFSGRPLFFMILGDSDFAFGSWYMDGLLMDLSHNNAGQNCDWNGNQVSFYASQAGWQLNQDDVTYHVFVFYLTDTDS